MPQTVYLREPYGGPRMQVAIHIVLDDSEAELLRERQHAVTIGRRGVGACRVMEQCLSEERAGPMRAAGALEGVRIGTRRGPRNRDEVDVLTSELFEQHEITRVFYEYCIAGGKQDASQEVEGLGGAESCDNVGGPRGNAVLHQPRRDLLAQLKHSLGWALQPRLRPAAARQAVED